MQVNVLQTDIAWGHPQENIEHVAQMLKNAPDADLLVLPEMWTTGFITDSEGVQDDEALQWMMKTAAERKASVCGSIAVKKGEKSYNRLYFVKPDGNVSFYDKRHLFGYGGEKKYYQGGQERKVVSVGDFRFLLLTCYDLRFPVWARCQDDYDAIIVVANWPASRKKVWDVLLRARAIENQCYVIGCNRVGDDPQVHYMGESRIIDPRGNIIAEAKDKETIISAGIDKASLVAFREKFNVLADRDLFILK